MAMSSMRDRARAVLAAAIFAAAVSACGDDQAPTEPERPPPAAELPPVEPSPTPSTTPAPAAALAPAPATEPAPAPPAPPPAQPPQISLEELGARIKATPAIGTFSKLALKNDIDDLVDDLRGYHENHRGDIEDLHQRYEALVLKLLALLEDDEPELALALSRSRDDIWSRLVNPVEFAKLPT
jgi:hypothetical protein